MPGRTLPCRLVPVNAPVQRDQPPGVPPLELTGERTLPDVPAENYWFRRHLVVYEWIAARTRGLRVIDMACGEGYGSALLAGSAASVVGVDANPHAHEHARLRYRAANLRCDWAGTRCTSVSGSRAPSTTGSRRRSVRATSGCARAARPTSTARWTSSRCAGREPRRARRRAGDRAPHPHALRRGLRHMAV